MNKVYKIVDKDDKPVLFSPCGKTANYIAAGYLDWGYSKTLDRLFFLEALISSKGYKLVESSY